MSSVIDPTPEQPAADELVAYLDGELPPEECCRIEERLAADPVYRRQLRDLDQAWEALDVLPTPRASDDFARTTMELVTVAARADATTATSTAAGAKRRRTGWFAAAAAAGVCAGFLLAWLLLPDRTQTLLQDLPVIRWADTLRQVENVEFLRHLAASVPADELNNDAVDSELAQMASLETRRKWVEGLPPEDKAVLLAQAKRFGELDRTKKNQLRELDREISAGGVELQRAFVAYDQWLSRLTAGQQEDLRQDLLERSVDDQVDVVRQLMREENEQASRRLSTKDAETLRNNLRAIAAEHKVDLMASPPSRRDGERERRPIALTMIARELFRNGDARGSVRSRLTSDLSPQAQAQLEQLSGPRRGALLWRWILDALQTKVDPDELERFFASKLNTDQREQLLNLSPQEMQARLERLYYATELGFGDVAEWWGQFRDIGRPPSRPGGDRPDFRPSGPPGARGQPGDRPEFFGRERMHPRPGGPPRPREGPFPEEDRPFDMPPEGPPPDGPGPPGGPGQGPRPGDPPPRGGEPPIL